MWLQHLGEPAGGSGHQAYNFVGSVTLIADQPIRAGDFCKAGEAVGTVEQIRYLLAELRSVLLAHPKESPDQAWVRFVELGADSLKVEIFSYVQAKDFSEFLEVQEELILQIIEVVEAGGSGFAFPSQTLLARDMGIAKEDGQEAAENDRKPGEDGKKKFP